MTDEVKIDVDRPQHSSPITYLLDNKVATILGVGVCGWALLVLVEGGMVSSLGTKDCGFVTLLSFLAFSRCWCYWWPQAHRSFTETTQSLLADYFSRPYNKILFNGSKILFAMFSVYLAVKRLVLQDFGKNQEENMEGRDFVLNFFYGLTLAEAVVFLIELILSLLFPKKRLADVSEVNDDPPESPKGDRRNGLENVSGGGHEEGEPKDGPQVDLEEGLGRPVNQSNECNGVAQMALPANQSNDLKSEGPADSPPNLRQRRREISKRHPACSGKSRCTILGCNHNSSNTSKVSGLSVGVNRSELLEQSTKEE